MVPTKNSPCCIYLTSIQFQTPPSKVNSRSKALTLINNIFIKQNKHSFQISNTDNRMPSDETLCRIQTHFGESFIPKYSSN